MFPSEQQLSLNTLGKGLQKSGQVWAKYMMMYYRDVKSFNWSELDCLVFWHHSFSLRLRLHRMIQIPVLQIHLPLYRGKTVMERIKTCREQHFIVR